MSEQLLPTLLAGFYILAAIIATVSAVRYWRKTHDRRAVSALMFCSVLLAFAFSALVAIGGLNGFIRDQNTITFWSAVARSFAAILALELAWRWWRAV